MRGGPTREVRGGGGRGGGQEPVWWQSVVLVELHSLHSQCAVMSNVCQENTGGHPAQEGEERAQAAAQQSCPLRDQQPRLSTFHANPARAPRHRDPAWNNKLARVFLPRQMCSGADCPAGLSPQSLHLCSPHHSYRAHLGTAGTSHWTSGNTLRLGWAGVEGSLLNINQDWARLVTRPGGYSLSW